MGDKSLDYRLDNKTDEIIKTKTGFSIDELADMTVDEWHDILRERKEHELRYASCSNCYFHSPFFYPFKTKKVNELDGIIQNF